MPAFYLTLIAVILAGFGARDQRTLASLALRQGRRPGLLLVGAICAGLTAVLAAWAGAEMLSFLPPPARFLFAALAVAFAGVESMLLSPRRSPAEPTHSLGALALVLTAKQITDAARFLVFGLAVGMAAPVASGAGGALGGVALVGFAWTFPEFFERKAAGSVRRVVGILLVVAAIAMLLSEFRIL